jgi:hypothetical protein
MSRCEILHRYILPLHDWLLLGKSDRANAPTEIELSNRCRKLNKFTNRDLPSYANRVSQRSRRLNRTPNLSSSVIIAGRPEFAPLTLGPGPYTSDPGAEITTTAPKQVFITTLERGYTARKPIQLQQYHWLFLLKLRTAGGWQRCFPVQAPIPRRSALAAAR